MKNFRKMSEKELDALEVGEMWDFLIEYEIATEDELNLVTRLKGYNEETMLDVLYIRSGYRSIKQYLYYEK